MKPAVSVTAVVNVGPRVAATPAIAIAANVIRAVPPATATTASAIAVLLAGPRAVLGLIVEQLGVPPGRIVVLVATSFRSSFATSTGPVTAFPTSITTLTWRLAGIRLLGRVNMGHLRCLGLGADIVVPSFVFVFALG
jgi:hypothetical protein